MQILRMIGEFLERCFDKEIKKIEAMDTPPTIPEALVTLARQYEDPPSWYVWAANGPKEFDCSGFVVYLLRAFRLLNADYNAQMLRDKYPVITGPRPGALVMYGTDRATHVMICINDVECIGAQGGGSATTDADKAMPLDARVKTMPIKYRSDILGYYWPFG